MTPSLPRPPRPAAVDPAPPPARPAPSPGSQPLGSSGPFRSDPATGAAVARVTGSLPEWLRGDLVRTAPAVFAEGVFRAGHWFDGLALLYAFRIGDDAGRPAVRFEQRLLDSEMRARLAGGRRDNPGFGTRMNRAFLQRVFEPLPRANDNTNVHCVPFGDVLVAMTETSVQHEIDRATLATRGPRAYDDDLGEVFMLAHPHADFDRGVVVNAATDLSFRSGLVVYEHAWGARARRRIAKIPASSIPYLHSFGLTSRHAVLLGGPWRMQPWRALWSDRAYAEHFRWEPEAGTAIWRVDRATGAVHVHRAPATFVFHTVNTFERGDATVHDVVAYDDATIVGRLSASDLARGVPDLRARLVRYVLRHGVENATVEPLVDEGFEFPSIAYRRVGGRDYGVAWGAVLAGAGDDLRSEIVRVDVGTGAVRRAADPGFALGEPVFVERPGAAREGEGVLLAVGSHVAERRAVLDVLDAEMLDLRARCEIDVPVPLGFHGSFVRG